MKKKLEIVIILSHLMNEDGLLNIESIKRIEKGVQIFNKRKCSFLATSGWAYRKDCSLALGDAVSNYIKKNFKLDNCQIISDTNSRDTVGDAFYLRKKLRKIKYTKLIVVTSDVHVNRTKIIFENFFSNAFIEVYGVKTKLANNINIIKNEKLSLTAFIETFKDVDFKKELSIYNALKENHPYYNGEIYEKI
tara:strand:+ start:101 stop:676 length:576 start_codon:yes stop_codon:yes gene_type:complete